MLNINTIYGTMNHDHYHNVKNTVNYFLKLLHFFKHYIILLNFGLGNFISEVCNIIYKYVYYLIIY